MLKCAITTIKEMTEMNRKPTHPGEMLREEFMPDYNLSVAKLAELLGTTRQTVNELINERRSLSVDLAVRLACLFGTTPQYWINMQNALDIYNAKQKCSEAYQTITPIAQIMEFKASAVVA